MTPDDSAAISPSQPKKMTSRTIMKWLLWLTLGLASLLLVIALLLTYWFPANMVRQELEVRLSELLEGTVTIHFLSFNALTGLQATDVAFRKADQPPLTLERLALDYSLWGLLTGTFRINEVTVEQANISLNLPELTQIPSSEKPVSPPPTKPTSLPNFPLSIDLNSLAIIDSQLQVIVSHDLQVALSTINLRSSGVVSPEEANLNGTLSVNQLALDFQGKHVQLPLDIRFDTQINLSTQHLNLEELTITSDPAWHMTLSGTVSDFFTQDNIQLSLTDTQFNLESIVKLAQAFVPPEWASAKIQGSFSPTFSLNGSLPDKQFEGTIQVGLQSKELQVNLPSLKINLGPTALDIRAEDIRVHNNQPTEGTLSANVTLQDFNFHSYRLENFRVVLASNAHLSGPFSGTVNVKGSTIFPPTIVGTAFSLPFDLALDTKGNYQTQEFHLSNLDLDMGTFGSLQAKADITPHISQTPGMDASLELRVRPRLQAFLSLLSQDQLQGLAVNAGTNPESLILRATALLGDDFQPEWATGTAALKLSPLKATWNKIAVSGDLDQLTFLLSSKYQKLNGAFQGTMGVSTKLSDLQAKKNLTLDALNLILKSSFQGNVSPTFQPLKVRSQEQLQVTLQNVGFIDQSLTAMLPSLKLVLNTKEDLIKQDYIVERLKVISKDILDLNMQGRFSQATQQFKINLQAPLIHIGNALPFFSGPLMKGMDSINPKGWVEFTMQADGRIPEKSDLEKLVLPVGLKSTLRLHDLAGGIAGYQLQGGKGTLAVGYSPNASPQTQFTTNMQINRIQLPDTLPLKELTDTALQFTMTSPDLNEVHLDSLHLTSQGIDLSTKAALVGLRAFLASSTTPLGTQLAKLYVQMNTQLEVNLEPLQHALQTFGLSGRGKALVEMDLYKQEQGTLKTSIHVNGEKLSILKEGTKLKNMNGGLHIRKSLHWNPSNANTSSPKSFLPSDRIAQLKTYSGKGQQIAIDEFTFGPLIIQNLSTHVAFQEHVFRIQNLAMNLLGGGIGGNIAIAVEHPLRLTTNLEIAHLDINELMTKNERISGDSKIAATLAVDARLQDETGAIDLSRLTCQINITHIGKESLDRLLVFLDPEGSNPTLSNARAQLQLANPSHVRIDIARGQLNLHIEFQGSLIPTFTLNRIPIAKMKHIEKLTAAIPTWKTLVPLLDMIGAETYSFSPEGKVILQ